MAIGSDRLGYKRCFRIGLQLALVDLMSWEAVRRTAASDDGPPLPTDPRGETGGTRGTRRANEEK